MYVQQRVWCRLGTLILIASLGSACAGNVPPVYYTTGETEVDLQTRDLSIPARRTEIRQVSQYRYDGTDVDLASPRGEIDVTAK